MGYVCRLQGKLEAALDYFYKLNNILLNNVEVLCQLAAMYVLFLIIFTAHSRVS